MIAAETNLIHIPDHAETLRDRTLSQWRDKPVIQALIRALGRGIQEVEEVGFDLLVSRTLAASTGAQLDQWGGIVGELRYGLGDADYRRFIEARILANTSSGNIDDTYAVWAKVTGPGTARHREMWPAGGQLEVIRGAALVPSVRRRIRRLTIDVKPAGVTMYRVEALRGAFGFGAPYTGFDAGGFARSF